MAVSARRGKPAGADPGRDLHRIVFPRVPGD